MPPSPVTPPQPAASAAPEPAAVPTTLIVKNVLLAGGALVLVVLGLLAFEPPGIPDRIETIGPFELVTHSTGRRGRPSMEWFSVRHRGQPFVLRGKAGMYRDREADYDTFNSAITFPSTEPAIVVNAGDPINGGSFYLLRERNGAVDAQFVGPSHGGVSAELLGLPAKPRQVPVPRNVTTRRARLEGGRWVLLGDYCVLDTQTLTGYPFAEAKDGSLNQSAAPLAMSPDQRSVVRIGTESYPKDGMRLLVFDFVASSSYVLPIDQVLMRVSRWEDIDRAWLDHYFEWQHEDGRADRLVQRTGVTPLPYKGRLTVNPSDGYREYRVAPVSPAMRDVLVAFVKREFQAAAVPPEGGPDAPVLLKSGELVVTVSRHDDEVVVYMSRDQGGTKLVAEIARRFDQDLATRAHDALFVVPGDTSGDRSAGAQDAPPAGR